MHASPSPAQNTDDLGPYGTVTSATLDGRCELFFSLPKKLPFLVSLPLDMLDLSELSRTVLLSTCVWGKIPHTPLAFVPDQHQ